ncbi:MAG: hypothetical protein ACO331_03735 [Prochlorothrix sp.]
MVLPRDFPSSPQIALRLLRSHPLLVAWLTVVTALCFATGVAVSVLFDPSAGPLLNTQARQAAAENGTGLETELEPTLEADPAALDLGLGGAAIGEDDRAAEGSDFIDSASTPGVLPTVPKGATAGANAANAETDPKPTTALAPLQDDFVIIAPAPEFAQQRRTRKDGGAVTASDALDRPETGTETPGDRIATQTTIAFPRSDSPSAPVLSPALRLWLLGSLGLGCGLGALWVSQRLMAEFKLAPSAAAEPHSIGVAQGSMTGSPQTAQPPSALAQLASSPPAPPPSISPQAIPPQSVPPHVGTAPAAPHQPNPAPGAALQPASIEPVAIIPTVEMPPNPDRAPEAAPPKALPPAAPQPPGLADEVDLRKRRSASSWFDA